MCPPFFKGIRCDLQVVIDLAVDIVTHHFFYMKMFLITVIQNFVLIILFLSISLKIFAEMIFSVFKNLEKNLTHVVCFDGMVVGASSLLPEANS